MSATRLSGVSVPPLLARLVDDAGLFPPAALSMPAAVAGHVRAVSGPHAALMDRFLCPVSRLHELDAELRARQLGGAPWDVVAILDGATRDGFDGFAADAAALAARPSGEPFRIVTVEGRIALDPSAQPPALEDAVDRHRRALDALPISVAAFLELQLADVQPPRIAAAAAALADVRARATRAIGAKVRCGGLVAEAFPSTAELAAFLVASAAHRLPFKATAGLHHALRHVDPATGLRHHGFVNLLVACGLALAGSDAALLADVLADEDPGAFALVAGAPAWRGTAIAGDPRVLLTGYGSCSFDEPTADLHALGWLADDR